MDDMNFNFLPSFPQKKFMGSLDTKFLQERMMQLGLFFNAFLGNNKVARNKLVMTYFASKPLDQESLDNISQFNQMIKGAQ
jgi:hypothetical protein